MDTKKEIKKILEDLILDVTTDKVPSFEPYVRRIRELYGDVDTLPLEQRREAFIESVRPYVEEMGKEEANRFVKYWMATSGKKGRLMAFEKEKSWNLKARISTWMRNKRKFSITNMLNKGGRR